MFKCMTGTVVKELRAQTDVLASRSSGTQSESAPAAVHPARHSPPPPCFQVLLPLRQSCLLIQALAAAAATTLHALLWSDRAHGSPSLYKLGSLFKVSVYCFYDVVIKRKGDCVGSPRIVPDIHCPRITNKQSLSHQSVQCLSVSFMLPRKAFHLLSGVATQGFRKLFWDEGVSQIPFVKS